MSNSMLSNKSFCLHCSTSSGVMMSLHVITEKPNFTFCHNDNEEKALFKVT